MDESLINKTTAGNQDQPGVAGLRGIQFAVVWTDHDRGNIRGQMLGVNAAPSGNEFIVNFPQPPGTKRQLPAIIESGVGLVVAWIEQLPGAPAQLKLRTLEADTLSGPESQVSTAEVEPLIRPALGRLPGGGLVGGLGGKRGGGRGRQARGRTHPRAALQSRRHEKRSGVSRQYRARPASGPDGREPLERK